MFSALLLGLVVIAVVTIVFCEGRDYRAHAKKLKSRRALTPVELHQNYLPDVPLIVIEQLLAIVAEQFGENPTLVRPEDNHCLINDDLDPSSYIKAIEKAFGFQFTPNAIESLDGTFGSIARYCASHRQA